MESDLKGLFGSLIQAIGTVISAVGNTPIKAIPNKHREALDLWGNVLQATGNALAADTEGEQNFEAIGNEIQATGNSLVVYGLINDKDGQVEQRVIITGNWFQALGGLVALGDEFDDEPGIEKALNVNGNLLQSIGNSMQAIGGIHDLRKENRNHSNSDSIHEGQTIGITGSWIQAVGSVVSFIGQIKEEGSNENSKG